MSVEVPEWVWRNRKHWRKSRLPVSGGWSLEALQSLGISSAPQLTEELTGEGQQVAEQSPHEQDSDLSFFCLYLKEREAS